MELTIVGFVCDTADYKHKKDNIIEKAETLHICEVE